MKLVTKFLIGDFVVIPDLDNCNAVIRQICIGVNGTTYEVAWFHNGESKTAWLFGDELMPTVIEKKPLPAPPPSVPIDRMVRGGGTIKGHGQIEEKQ